MAIGSFALVGLKVTGPNMRETSKHYFEQLNLADISIMSDYGLNEEDQNVINGASGIKEVEYVYLKDVVVKGTDTSFRIFSESESISKYQLESGRMPSKNNEIAIDVSNQEKYKIGDTITFHEKADSSEDKVLKRHTFKVVGYISSPELISSNMGQSTAGSGELKGYAVVKSDVFDSDIYMMARLTYQDTKGVDPYSDEYTDLVQKHKEELEDLLEEQPEIRLSAIKEEAYEEIQEGQDKIEDAKSKLKKTEKKLKNAKAQLEDAKKEIADKQKELDEGVENAQSEIADAEQQIKEAEATMQEQIAQKQAELEEKQEEYRASVAKLNEKKQELAKGTEQIEELQSELDKQEAQLQEGKTQYIQGIESLEQAIAGLKQQLQDTNLSKEEQTLFQQQLAGAQEQLAQVKAEYQQFLSGTYEPSKDKIVESQKQLDAKKEELKSAETAIQKSEQQLAIAKEQLEDGKQQIAQAQSQGEQQLASKKAELEQAKVILNEQKTSGQKQIDEATQELEKKQKEYEENKKEYEKQKPEAEEEIEEKEEELKDAQETVDSLENPVYSVYTRRETPGSDGYKIYESVSSIIQALANIFPIFLYFIADLVTFTTMTRFVDEERTNSGTLKALGYSDKDIWKKFTLYGFVASTLGSIVGIILGHIALPIIAYNAYRDGFTLPQIELHFYFGITIIAFLLSFISAVVPAYFVAVKELHDKPANLLLPKPPTSGSKIWLQHITPIWKRMSFTHKVTARNIFRYKKRMFMTIFGVCGSVALLFTGFGVKNSISGINERQFGNIINYDLIALKNENIKASEEEEIDTLLNSESVKQQIPVYFEEMSVMAGKNNDRQSIDLIATNKKKELKNYIALFDRKSKNTLQLKDDGVILSERLAKLLHVQKGDSITVQDSSGNDIEMKVSDISEMYMGHFIFMNEEAYEKIFEESYEENANLVNLKDNSLENTEEQASEFMSLSGIKGVVQNTTIRTQINTIVDSLNTIMRVLIIVAGLLAVVILYNLTNINVSERIRELCTIKVLGFYNQEVTMYIYRETMVLSLLGILVGYGAGILLHSYIINTVAPDNVMFNPQLYSNGFIIPTIIIFIILIVLGFIVNQRLKRVDMLEALKSVE